MTLSVAVSCSDVKFTNAPSSDCLMADSCEVTPQGELRSKNIEVVPSNKQVDILFVVDNSRTMIEEQQKIADRLSSFFSILNGANIDWRVAITTTDMEDAKNQHIYPHQEYRNGALVPFLTSSSGGSFTNPKTFYITKNTPNYTNLFFNTVKRPESIWCLQNQGACPSIVSGDERGTYSAFKNISTQNSFRRSSAQLHIVVISDEDVRSNGGVGFANVDRDYSLEKNDKVDTLVDYLQRLDKVAKVHSIVKLHSDNYSFNRNSFNLNYCVSRHKNYGDEFVGCHYIDAAIKTGGVVWSKDESNYSNPLSAIADSIQENTITTVAFGCVPESVDFSALAGWNYPNNLTNPQVINPQGKDHYNFNPPLREGFGLKAQWFCPRN